MYGCDLSAEIGRRRMALLRLAAAAALETYAEYRPLDAWRVAGELPEPMQLALQRTAAGGISDEARRGVTEIVDEYFRRRRSKATLQA